MEIQLWKLICLLMCHGHMMGLTESSTGSHTCQWLATWTNTVHTVKKTKPKRETQNKAKKYWQMSKGPGHKYFIYNFYLESLFSTNDLAPAGICKVVLLCSPGRRPWGQILLVTLTEWSTQVTTQWAGFDTQLCKLRLLKHIPLAH